MEYFIMVLPLWRLIMATLSLADKTRTLLLLSKEDLTAIAALTNVSYDWLIKFKSNKIKDPSVNKVQSLYEHLSGSPLFTE